MTAMTAMTGHKFLCLEEQRRQAGHQDLVEHGAARRKGHRIIAISPSATVKIEKSSCESHKMPFYVETFLEFTKTFK